MPDVYAATIFFPHAVRLDMPYQYRMLEIDFDGNVRPGIWQERDDWTEILDITTSPKEIFEKQFNNESQ